VRERKGFWADLRKRIGKGEREREELENFLERAGCFHAGAEIF
jgi:hypothetical protein